MPRDLNSMPELARESSGDDMLPKEQGVSGIDLIEKNPTSNDPKDRITRDMERQAKLHELHPYGGMLNIKDVDGCLLVENAAFENPAFRCSREKFVYRLTKCPELCAGSFISLNPDSEYLNEELSAAARTIDGNGTRKQLLIGHIIATKTTNMTVQDEDMEMPPNWKEVSTLSDDTVGHKEHGRTIALHSLCVLPQFANIGVGKMLLRDYIAKMFEHDVADRIAIITFGHLVPYYERFGFKNLGKSNASFGGGDWVDMIYDFTQRKAP